MKLSAVIELMLTSGEYNQCNPYMCNVLKHAFKGKYREHVESVQDMVCSLNTDPDRIIWRGDALACVLHDLGFIKLGRGYSWFPYTRELYVWWVFDLKRKGL